MENGSIFAKKIKDKNFWKVVGYNKRDLDKLTKSIRDHNITYQQIKNDCELAITIIEQKQGKVTVDYIKGYNASEKYTKAIQKATNQYSCKDVYNLMMHKVGQQLDLYSRYSTLNQLTIDWLNIAPKNLILNTPIKMVNDAIFKYLNISVTES